MNDASLTADLGASISFSGVALASRTEHEASRMNTLKSKNGIFLVSLGSQFVTPAALERVIAFAAKAGVRLWSYLLDSPEIVNQRVLYNLDEAAAADRVEEQCLKIVSQVQIARCTHVEIRRVSELFADAEFSAAMNAIRRAVEANERFARMCENQVFINLQPILRRLGAKNRRHPIVKELTDYILVELALKLYLIQSQQYVVEYCVGKDTQVWQALVSGKFQEFPAVAPPEFVTIDPPPPKPGRLELEEVSFRYGGGKRLRGPGLPDVGLQDVSLTASGISAILGPSGAYKSTLLRVVAGHLPPSEGIIRIGEDDVTHLPSEARRVATVFQDYALFPHLSGVENVIEGGRLLHHYSSAQRRWLAGMYLRRLNVAHCADRLPKAMSGGEQQRIAIARALMAEPNVLLLDEPTAAIDTLQRDDLARLVKQLTVTSPSLVTLIVSHDRDFVLDVADELAVMDRGRLLAMGHRSELLSRPPSRRVAEILGTHSVMTGTLHDGGIFTATENNASHVVHVAEAPPGLTGRNCFALVRHDGVSFRQGNIEPQTDDPNARGVITEVVDRGPTVRATVRLSATCELVVVTTKVDVSHDLREGAIVELDIHPDAVWVVPN